MATFEDATQDLGVSGQNEQQEEAPKSERDLALAEIEAELEQQPRLEVLSADEEDAPKKSERREAPEVLDEADYGTVKVKVKVDGQEVLMPLAEVAKGYQKDAVASRRLEQAARERQELEAFRRQLAEQEQRLTQARQVPLSPEGDAGDDLEAQIKAAMSALIDGDEEQAAQALRKVVGRQAATPAIDEDAIIAKAEARIEAKRQEAENADAWREFVDSNPAFADETSKQRQYGDYLFNTVYGPKLEAGELSYREALRAAAQDVATVFQGEPEAPARSVREERKQRIDNLPTAGARAVRQAPKSESVEDVLEDMRRMRGQPV
jgi:hypothetical protein